MSNNVSKVTREDLWDMPEGHIFRRGEFLMYEMSFRWLAVKTEGQYGWHVIYDRARYKERHIADNGVVLTDEKTIRRLVPCLEDAFEHYIY